MKKSGQNILIIQTAFIGDVILATCLIEFCREVMPDCKVDFVTKSGNKVILEDHPGLRRLILWDKGKNKLSNLRKVIGQVREVKYDYLINVHRFGSSGLMTFMARAKQKIGYRQNPFSFCYDRKISHRVENGYHETERLHDLVSHIDERRCRPKLHIPAEVTDSVRQYQSEPYLVIAPNSVWFTKQYPAEKWVEFIDNTAFEGNIYLIGAPSENIHTEGILRAVRRVKTYNLCGQLSLLQSAALISGAAMTFTNDSGPLHLATATNAPVRAIYCSTVPEFGFGPLSDDSKIIEVKEKLPCRPCGLHGHKECPEGHFKCGMDIHWRQLELF